MITGYYGKDGAMTIGWKTKSEAVSEFEAWYQDEEFSGCCVTEIRSGEWVIAY